MAIRRFFLLSCLSLSFFLTACGEEKPVAPQAGPQKSGNPSGRNPFVVPVANPNEESDEDEGPRQLTEAEIDRIPVEKMRPQLMQVFEQIESSIEKKFSSYAAGPKVVPLIKERLKKISKEFENAPAKRSSELVELLQEKVSELEDFANEEMRKAEAEMIRYKIQPKKEVAPAPADENEGGDESGEYEGDDYYDE